MQVFEGIPVRMVTFPAICFIQASCGWDVIGVFASNHPNPPGGSSIKSAQ